MPFAGLAAIQPGDYISWWKALILLIVLLLWARLLAWIDKDGPSAHLNRDGVNAGMFGGLVLGLGLFFFLPGFALALAALLFVLAADVGTYLALRANKIGLKDLNDQFQQWLRGLMGANKQKKVVAVAGQVLVMDKKGAAQSVPDAEAPDRLPYDASQALLTTPLRYGAQRIDLTAGDACAVTYSIDGVRYEGEAMDRNFGGAAVTYLKRIAGLDMNERRKPQTGFFKTALDGVRQEIQIISFGSAAGESLRLIMEPKKRHELKLDQLGFMPDQYESLRKLIVEGGGGIVILSAPRGHGLASLNYAVIRTHDAFLFHIQTIERQPEEDLEGITQNNLGAAATAGEEAKQASWVFSQQPDVVMMTSIESPSSAVDACKFADSAHRVYVGLRATSVFDAMRQWRKLVGDDVLATKNLRLVVAGRLIRRLCNACKVGYSPDPATLRKLNMNPEEVGKLYMARKEPMLDAKGRPVPCNFCHDLGYHGRFGVFETFMIEDDARKVIVNGGSDNQLKQIFRKQRGLLLQELALAQVRAGETSVEEVLRVLKSDAAAAHAAPGEPPPRATLPRAPSSAQGSGGRARKRSS